MAVFGVPVGHGDDPDRAVAAALELVERVAELDGGLTVKVGIETGEILAVSDSDHLAVTGEAVNAAARLQQAAEPGQVLVGERAARACLRTRLEPGERVEAKGINGGICTYLAAGGDPGEGDEVLLVGRIDDLDLLRVVARRAAHERVPQLVTIMGEAGIGKTRLANELFSELSSDSGGWRVVVGRNPPYGRGIAFWALGEILRDASGSGPEASADAVEKALGELLAGLGAEDAEDLACSLSVAIGGGREATTAATEDVLKRAWRRFVSLLASDRPLVIGVDDAHWADEGLLDLLEEAAFGLHDSPVLILCTSRPELADRRPDFGKSARNITQLELRALDSDAARQLAELLLPERARDDADRVADAAGGNPFFLEEVSRAIGEGAGELAPDGLPDTVQAAIAARMDQLPENEKRVLQHAGVLGHTFGDGSLGALYGEPVESDLEALRRKALIEERPTAGPGHWAFRHQLIRDVAYGSLPRVERAGLHERVAGRLGEGEAFAERAELIAYHLTQAADLDATGARRDAASDALIEAAHAATRRGAGARALELYEHAATLAGDEARRIEVLGTAGDVALRSWRGDHAIRILREAAVAGERAGEPALAAAAYARAVEVGARYHGISGEIPESELRPMLDRGRALVSEDDIVTRARLLLDEAWLAWLGGRFAEMAEPTSEALALARESGDPQVIQGALDAATGDDWNQGRQRAAVEHTRERLELLSGGPAVPPLGAPNAFALGSHALDVEHSDALHMMILSLIQTGDFREALGYAKQASDLDSSRGVLHAAAERGLMASFYLGDWDEVLEMARRLRREWTDADRPPFGAAATNVACAGAVEGYRGEEAEAERWLGFAAELAGQDASLEQTEGVRMVRADVALHHGRFEHAASLLTDYVCETQWQPAYLATRAEARVRAGREDAAEAIEIASARTGEHRLAIATLLRARALQSGDEQPLRESLALFEEIECPYQAARSGWLLGGEARERAAATLERLGATEPAD